MPTFPWRIEGNIDVPDPDITVLFGDTVTYDSGETLLLHDFSKRVVVKLSELPAFLQNPVYVAAEGAPPMPIIGAPITQKK